MPEKDYQAGGLTRRSALRKIAGTTSMGVVGAAGFTGTSAAEPGVVNGYEVVQSIRFRRQQRSACGIEYLDHWDDWIVGTDLVLGEDVSNGIEEEVLSHFFCGSFLRHLRRIPDVPNWFADIFEVAGVCSELVGELSDLALGDHHTLIVGAADTHAHYGVDVPYVDWSPSVDIPQVSLVVIPVLDVNGVPTMHDDISTDEFVTGIDITDLLASNFEMVDRIEAELEEHVLSRIDNKYSSWLANQIEDAFDVSVDVPIGHLHPAHSQFEDLPAVEAVDGHMPSDPDFDGQYEDLNGNARLDNDDVVAFSENMNDGAITDNEDRYDFNGNDRIDSDDVVTLFEQL